MPFYSYLMVPKCIDGQDNTVIFLKFLAKPGQDCKKGTSLAVIKNSNKSYHLCVTYIGLVAEYLVKEGDIVKIGEKFCKYYAEGEDIPYGKAYVTIEPVDS